MSPAALDLSSGKKTCTQCRLEKPIGDFYKNARPGGFSRCKDCVGVYEAERRLLPDQREAARLRALRHLFKTKYHITFEEYERLLDEQFGVCAICLQSETARGRSGVVKPLAVDHDHETGMVRGLLCHRCNQLLGNAQDSADRLEAAVRYLGGQTNF